MEMSGDRLQVCGCRRCADPILCCHSFQNVTHALSSGCAFPDTHTHTHSRTLIGCAASLVFYLLCTLSPHG